MKTLREHRADSDREYLGALLVNAKGNLSEAARTAGVHRSEMYRLLHRHGMELPGRAKKLYRRVVRHLGPVSTDAF